MGVDGFTGAAGAEAAYEIPGFKREPTDKIATAERAKKYLFIVLCVPCALRKFWSGE
jgi:hypothetical protein